MVVLFFAQGAKAYFAWVVFSRPLRNSFLISRHHANIRRWCYGVAPWVDVSEIPWRLTYLGLGSRAERVRCFGLEFVRNIFCPEIRPIEALGYHKTKSHPEYPHRKKIGSVFCEPEHPKKHATLRYNSYCVYRSLKQTVLWYYIERIMFGSYV